MFIFNLELVYSDSISRILPVFIGIWLYYNVTRDKFSGNYLNKLNNRILKIALIISMIYITVYLHFNIRIIPFYQSLSDKIISIVGYKRQQFRTDLIMYAGGKNFFKLILQVMRVSILAPLNEELTYRFVLYGIGRNYAVKAVDALKLKNKISILSLKTLSIILLILLNVIIFSFNHETSAMADALIIGSLFVLIYEISGKLWVSITAHSICNFLICLSELGILSQL